jgi:hypothetical protein
VHLESGFVLHLGDCGVNYVIGVVTACKRHRQTQSPATAHVVLAGFRILRDGRQQPQRISRRWLVPSGIIPRRKSAYNSPHAIIRLGIDSLNAIAEGISQHTEQGSYPLGLMNLPHSLTPGFN